MKAVTWTIISLVIETGILVWFCVLANGCAAAHNSAITAQPALTAIHAESVLSPPHNLSWMYPSNEVSQVIFTVWETRDLSMPMIQIGQTTNLFFPVVFDAPQKFWKVGADWKVTQ